MRTLFPICTLLPALALATGCLSAEIDAPEICIGGLTMPYAPDVDESLTDQSISGDDLGVPDGDDVELELMVKSLSLTPVPDITDLEFVDSMSLRAASAEPDSELPEIVVVDTDDPEHRSDGSLYVEPEDVPDLAPLFTAGEVRFAAEFTGDLPPTVWQTQMELCIHARANIR